MNDKYIIFRMKTMISEEEMERTRKSLQRQCEDKIILLPPNIEVSEMPFSWIPCEKELPRKYWEVLCCEADGGMVVGLYSDNGWLDRENNLLYVRAWMELPEVFEG